MKKNQKFTIFVDMDEILADFVGGVLRIWQVDRAEFDQEQDPGVWDMCAPLERCVRRRYPDFGDMTLARFWWPINEGGPNFWQELDPTPHFNELVRALQATGQDWHVVTAPSECPTSYDGKVRWLKQYFGQDFDRFIISPHKYLLAQPYSVLIDDRDQNVEQFRVNPVTKRPTGALGIVFPTQGNTQHLRKANPVKYVVEQLSRCAEVFNSPIYQEQLNATLQIR